MNNRKIFNLFLLFTAILSGYSCTTLRKVQKDDVEKQIQSIKQEFVPDTRVEIFEVEVESRDGELVIKGATSSEKAYKEIEHTLEASSEKHIINQIRLLPDSSLKYTRGIINLSVGNIRSGAGHASTLITQALMGTPVKIHEKDGWWYRIQTPDNYIAWIDASGVKPLNKSKVKNWKASEKVIFIDQYGSVYKSKSKESNPVSDAVMGNIFKMTENSNHWYEVEFPDGRTGFLEKKKAITISEWQNQIQVTGESLVSLARSFMGVPYLWGGTSIKGVDCSGFVKIIYFMHGIILQRDASQQNNYGEVIPVKNSYKVLKPGDLLFFGESRVTHVGMYIGDNQFIHSAGRVKINSLNESDPHYSEYRANTLIRARRIVNSLEEAGISLYKENSFYQ